MPATDFGPSDPRPMFRMKSDFADATVGGLGRDCCRTATA